MQISRLVSKAIGEKKQWREYKARKQRLPENYRAALDAAQRYTYYSGLADGESVMGMLGDLLDFFEQGAANGTPIRQLVGENPVEFMDGFLSNYRKGDWRAAERDRLTAAIRHAAGEDDGGDSDGEGTR
jgi:DNA-binding ferritin-like protein (Dps family)